MIDFIVMNYHSISDASIVCHKSNDFDNQKHIEIHSESGINNSNEFKEFISKLILEFKENECKIINQIYIVFNRDIDYDTRDNLAYDFIEKIRINGFVYNSLQYSYASDSDSDDYQNIDEEDVDDVTDFDNESDEYSNTTIYVYPRVSNISKDSDDVIVTIPDVSGGTYYKIIENGILDMNVITTVRNNIYNYVDNKLLNNQDEDIGDIVITMPYSHEYFKSDKSKMFYNIIVSTLYNIQNDINHFLDLSYMIDNEDDDIENQMDTSDNKMSFEDYITSIGSESGNSSIFSEDFSTDIYRKKKKK